MENNAILPIKNIIRTAVGVGALLLVPLVAMQFTQEVQWTLSDFVVMGAMLFIAGLLLDVVWRTMGKYRTLVVVGVAFLFLWL